MSLRSGLVAEYHFSGNGNDSSGNGNNGTVTGATLTTDKNAVANQAYSFNGISNKISLINNSQLSLQGSFSFSCWVNITSNTTWFSQLSKRTSGGLDYQFAITSGTGKMRFDGFGVASKESISAIPNGIWTLLTYTYDGTNLKMYINGSLDSTHPQTGNLSNLQSTISIGTDNVGNFANGVLDELKIYNRTLTAYEIYQLYIGYDTTANQVGTLRSGLISEYHLDTTTDTGSNGFNLTTNGAPTLTTDKNGVVNKARNLSSGNNYHFSPINWALYNSYTISCWVKNGLGAGQYLLYIQRDNSNFFFNYLTVYQNKASLVYASGLTLQSTSVINDNVWHLVTTTYDGSNVKMYVDGKLETSVAHTGNVTQTGGSYTTMTQDIGYNNISTSQPYVGSLDELKIYDRALSDTEILMLYYGYDTTADSIDTLTQGLIAGYHLDTLNDISGNGNTLTNSGTTLTTDKNGVVNKARNFNGVTSTYLNATTINNTQLQGSISFNSWIKPTTLTNQGDIFSTDNYPSVRGFALETQVNGYGVPNTFVFLINTASGQTALQASPNKLANGVWAMITGTWNASTNSMSVYVNGVLDNASFKSTAATGSVLNNASTVFIGRGANVGQPFNGIIDENRIYNRILTEDEIIELNYNYDVPTMSAISAPTGYSKKVNGITPSKVNGVVVANISKVNGI